MEAEQSDLASYEYGHLDRAAASGLSRRAYADEAGVKLHRLYCWRSRRKAVSEARGGPGGSPWSKSPSLRGIPHREPSVCIGQAVRRWKGCPICREIRVQFPPEYTRRLHGSDGKCNNY